MSRFLVAFLLGLLVPTSMGNCCHAQDGIDLDGLRRQQAAFMEMHQQQGRIIAAAQQNLHRKIVSDYRRQAGDYSTPDSVIINRLESQYFAQNPQAYHQKLAEDQYYAREYQKNFMRKVYVISRSIPKHNMPPGWMPFNLLGRFTRKAITTTYVSWT